MVPIDMGSSGSSCIKGKGFWVIILSSSEGFYILNFVRLPHESHNMVSKALGNWGKNMENISVFLMGRGIDSIYTNYWWNYSQMWIFIKLEIDRLTVWLVNFKYSWYKIFLREFFLEDKLMLSLPLNTNDFIEEKWQDFLMARTLHNPCFLASHKTVWLNSDSTRSSFLLTSERFPFFSSLFLPFPWPSISSHLPTEALQPPNTADEFHGKEKFRLPSFFFFFLDAYSENGPFSLSVCSSGHSLLHFTCSVVL